MRPETHLRPTSPPADPAAAAVRELAARLRADFEAALVAEEAPSYEELEAYVEGRMGADEAEAFAARIGDDPLLALEVDDLLRLQDRLSRARRAARTRWVWAAAAALALMVVGTFADRSLRPEPGLRSASHAVESVPIFRDGFESGDAGAWER